MPPQHVSSSPSSRTVGKEVLLIAWQSGKKAKDVTIHIWLLMLAFLLSFMTFKMRFIIIITPNECNNAHFRTWCCCSSYQDRLCDFVVFQSLSRVQLCAAPRTAAHQASLPSTISQSLLKRMFIESVMQSNHLILCRLLLLLLSIFPSIRVFSNESVLRIKSQSIGASA